MTCTDCLHGELCMSRNETIYFNKTEYRDLDNVEKFCEDFKNKADVVEVVRCKDCDIPHNKWTGCPKLNGLIPPPDFFCGYGERRIHNG